MKLVHTCCNNRLIALLVGVVAVIILAWIDAPNFVYGALVAIFVPAIRDHLHKNSSEQDDQPTKTEELV